MMDRGETSAADSLCDAEFQGATGGSEAASGGGETRVSLFGSGAGSVQGAGAGALSRQNGAAAGPDRDACADLDFDALYVTYYARLFNHVRRMVGSADDAADIVHDLFVDLIQNNRLEGVAEPQRYLYRAARNAAFGHFRSARVKRSTALDEHEALAATIADDRIISAEAVVIGRQEVERVKAVIKTLTAKEQKVIADFYVRGLGWKAIAKDLGVCVRTARNVRYDALRMIKKELMREGEAR